MPRDYKRDRLIGAWGFYMLGIITKKRFLQIRKEVLGK